jgi:antitoxin PrlF
MLVTQRAPAAPATDDDPALVAFLAFVDQDLRAHPERVRAMTGADIAGLEKLLEGVVVDRDEDLGNYTLP